MGQLSFTTGLALSMLFIIAITTFAVNFAVENNADVVLSDDGFGYGQVDGLNATVEEFYNDVNGSYSAFKESDLSAGVDFTTAPSTLRKDFGYLEATKSGLSSAFNSVLGGRQGFGIFLTVFMGLIGLFVVAYWWKSIKGGLVD